MRRHVTTDRCRSNGCQRCRDEEDRITVKCQECGKRFRTLSMLPECPTCGGSDIDVA